MYMTKIHIMITFAVLSNDNQVSFIKLITLQSEEGLIDVSAISFIALLGISITQAEYVKLIVIKKAKNVRISISNFLNIKFVYYFKIKILFRFYFILVR